MSLRNAVCLLEYQRIESMVLFYPPENRLGVRVSVIIIFIL